MDCSEVKDRIVSGGPLPETAHRHAEGCEACSALLSDPETARQLDAVRRGAEGSLDDVFTKIAGAVEADRSVLGWLRSRSTSLRLSLALAAALGIVGVTFTANPRPDLPVYPEIRMLLVISVLAVLLAGTIALALRPLQLAPVGTRQLAAAFLFALLAPLALAALPAAHWAHPESIQGVGTDLVPRAAACFFYGLGLGAPLLLLLRLLDRGEHGSLTVALFAAVSVGLAGNLVLQVHCALTHPTHLVLGHAPVGVAAVLVYAGVRRAMLSARSSPQ